MTPNEPTRTTTYENAELSGGAGAIRPDRTVAGYNVAVPVGRSTVLGLNACADDYDDREYRPARTVRTWTAADEENGRVRKIQ